MSDYPANYLVFDYEIPAEDEDELSRFESYIGVCSFLKENGLPCRYKSLDGKFALIFTRVDHKHQAMDLLKQSGYLCDNRYDFIITNEDENISDEDKEDFVLGFAKFLIQSGIRNSLYKLSSSVFKLSFTNVEDRVKAEEVFDEVRQKLAEGG